ncbi:MAG: TIGR00282 family metallophosphoesterase [Thermanaerothrix sp.]|nr:TIGR00282 family metallophosphoesterase [Thermanaerothrix sp.]
MIGGAMRVLFVGDVMGKPGRRALGRALPELRRSMGPFDFVVANGENAAAGFGITASVAQELFNAGVDVITGGNHSFDKREAQELMEEDPRILRPANYPPGVPGRGSGVFTKGAMRLGVVNLQGRAMQHPIDCPFRRALEEIEALGERCVLVDFHAETTSEKRALGLFLDGRVSAVIGTHTHVQTADEDLLPRGTAYITDAGMTGGAGGIIGMTYQSVIPRFLLGTPSKFEVCGEDIRFCGVVVDICPETGLALRVKRVMMRLSEPMEGQD